MLLVQGNKLQFIPHIYLKRLGQDVFQVHLLVWAAEGATKQIYGFHRRTKTTDGWLMTGETEYVTYLSFIQLFW